MVNIGNTIVTNINKEGTNITKITVKMQNGEMLDINISNNNDNNSDGNNSNENNSNLNEELLNKILYNMRTGEKIDISKIKINDEIDFENVYKRQGKIVFSEESKINVTRYLSGEELKEELLNSEFSFDLEYMEKNSNDNYILKGKIYDWYYSYSLIENENESDNVNENETKSFDIEIIVNNNTQILGIKGKIEEQLKELYKYGLYISLDKNELKKGKLVAINIEGMGC